MSLHSQIVAASGLMEVFVTLAGIGLGVLFGALFVLVVGTAQMIGLDMEDA